jgi:xylan 1,4-beta-xylosidase
LYAAYTAETLTNILFLAMRERINLLGAVTWAFEFEDQPYFEGFRTLATNGVDKPVLNAFRMFGLLGNVRVKATSSGALRSEDVIRDGVRERPDISVIATRKEHEVEILLWNYHDDDLPAAATTIDLKLSGLPTKASHGLLDHFRIDSDHSNAFAEWKEMGSPQSPAAEQYEQLQRAGQLQLLGSPAWMPIAQGSAHLQFALPRQGLSLVRITWDYTGPNPACG